MKTNEELMNEAFEKECAEYGFIGKSLDWQKGFRKGFEEGWNGHARKNEDEQR